MLKLYINQNLISQMLKNIAGYGLYLSFIFMMYFLILSIIEIQHGLDLLAEKHEILMLVSQNSRKQLEFLDHKLFSIDLIIGEIHQNYKWALLLSGTILGILIVIYSDTQLLSRGLAILGDQMNRDTSILNHSNLDAITLLERRLTGVEDTLAKIEHTSNVISDFILKNSDTRSIADLLVCQNNISIK